MPQQTTPKPASPPLVIYDDGRGELRLLTTFRSVFAVRTGAKTTLERIESTLGTTTAGLLPTPGLARLTAETLGPIRPTVNAPPGGNTLYVNGRCVLPDPGFASLAVGNALLEPGSSHVVAAHLSGAHAAGFFQTGALPTCIQTQDAKAPCLLHFPWDIIRFRNTAIDLDLAAILQRAGPSNPLPEGVTQFGDHPLSIDPAATVCPTAVFDTTQGPIVVEALATVRPGTTVIGPVWIGPNAIVSSNAVIKAYTSLGPKSRAGGEVGGTIFQSHSNKAHEGHLGDSWIGQWVNLGAGVTNSNLLNTYGQVSAHPHPGASKQRTGLQFYGCTVADHAKLAICTRVMTGAAVGMGAMYAATQPVVGAVPGCSWTTDKGTSLYRASKCIASSRAMMARRGVEPSDAYLERFQSLHKAETALIDAHAGAGA